MTPDNNLIIGIVLIGIALILAFLAYYILTSSKEEEVDEEKEAAAEPELVSAEGETIEGELDEPTSTQVDEEESIEEAPTPQPEAEAELPPVVEDDTEETTEDEPELETAQLELPEKDRVMIPVANLMRDEVTGELIVQVDDREYTSAEELRSSDDWNRVEFAVSDLNKWLTKSDINDRIPETESESITKQSTSMIDQINEILKQQLAESSEKNKAIRLIEGPGGTVRVLVGVHSYAFDDVPDVDVQRVIREAVAAWEEDQ
ncbi:MAG: hypothetical protein JSV37_13805 [Anaerolineaceae bacterium]|nr:MAG: hypothetical protein JSV37_13805 [Anaerolineaceae bacterium]